MSAVSFVVATGIAFLVEQWLHFLEGEMDRHHIPVAPLFKVALPYVTGVLLIGLSTIATVIAFREAWHIGGRHAEADERVPAEGRMKQAAGPTATAHNAPSRPGSPATMSRAQRRRQKRR